MQQTPQQMPPMTTPQKEHQWLQQLAGEWDADCEFTMEPGQPPVKSKGTESARMLGGFWLVAENKGVMMDKPFTGILSIGHDIDKKRFVGTWVDSMAPLLWNYTGSVDDAGKKLTLEAEGPCPMQPGKIFKFKESLEIKDADHKVFTSMMQGEDGKWTTNGTITYTRKK